MTPERLAEIRKDSKEATQWADPNCVELAETLAYVDQLEAQLASAKRVSATLMETTADVARESAIEEVAKMLDSDGRNRVAREVRALKSAPGTKADRGEFSCMVCAKGVVAPTCNLCGESFLGERATHLLDEQRRNGDAPTLGAGARSEELLHSMVACLTYRLAYGRGVAGEDVCLSAARAWLEGKS